MIICSSHCNGSKKKNVNKASDLTSDDITEDELISRLQFNREDYFNVKQVFSEKNITRYQNSKYPNGQLKSSDGALHIGDQAPNVPVWTLFNMNDKNSLGGYIAKKQVLLLDYVKSINKTVNKQLICLDFGSYS